MFGKIQEAELLPVIAWDVIIDSSKVLLKKPDERIFRLAEEKAGARGKEILFVENSSVHVESAKSFGWNTFLYDPKRDQEFTAKLLKHFRTLVRG